ncbi:MAG TPA: hypothetical protein VM580_11315, partial [Labilithrix sp.]|nr:hypothetical protein [Labilithrix sp.]
LALFRSRFLLGLVLFTLPGISTALIVYSDRGITYYGIFHIVAFAVVASILVSHALFWGGRELWPNGSSAHALQRLRSLGRPRR